MEYGAIFIISYALTAVVAFLVLLARLSAEVKGMRASGVAESEISRFKGRVTPPTIVAVLQTTLVTGTLLAAVISGIRYMLS